MSDPQEIDGSGYTHGGGLVFDCQPGPWRPEPIPVAWINDDETGRSVGPIRDGVIFGGRYDGYRVAPPSPRPLPGWILGPAAVTITWDPGAIT